MSENKAKHKHQIGKNVLETLTLGMYEDSRFIYREYIQNAADQIDVAVEEGILENKKQGEINITIDKNQRFIIVEDNATGISTDNALQFLGDVANSQKDPSKRKGFRGIGRLGGLGYCEKLVFETSYENENTKSIITLNAKLLKSIIENKSDKSDAATVIGIVTSLKKEKEESSKHYFKVHMINVTNDDLLDVDRVKEYLSMVAPVPFTDSFHFSKKIHDYFLNNNIKIEEYDICLNINKQKLYKAYKTEIVDKNAKPIYQVLDVDFFNIYDDEQKLIAIGWYGISDSLNKIMHTKNIERGFRLRKSNIQIGSEDTLNRFFNEDRFNHHFIGEVHALSSSFIPNARRDYFNDNKTCKTFERKIKNIFSEFYRLSHTSSDIHNRFKEIKQFIHEKAIFDSSNFDNQYQEDRQREKLEATKEKARKAKTKLDKIASKAETNKPTAIVYNHIAHSVTTLNEEDFSIKPKDNIYHKPALAQLNKNEQQIVYEIILIIEQHLKGSDAEKIKQLIAKKYN